MAQFNIGLHFSILVCFIFGCQVTSHKYKSLPLEPLQNHEMLLQKPQNFVDFQVIKVADWEAPLSGLLDLSDPQTKLAKLENKQEAISIYFYTIKHPKFGTYLIDSGIGESFTKGKENSLVSPLVESQMNFEKLKIYETTKKYLEKNKIQVKGIFYTHLHLDHVLGALEIDPSVPFYVGPNEVTGKQFINLFVQGSTNRMLGVNPELFQIDINSNKQTINIIDFFGDQSFYILVVPGHTPGSLAFLIPSKDGGHLVLGDTCHTRFGWIHQVIPGSFTSDPETNRKSLSALKSISASYKPKYIYPGHQERILSTGP
ncbi:MBL fold metallo-hydrolase [Leptospira sp. WS39.C2]